MSVRVSVEEQDASKPRTECRTATVRISQALIGCGWSRRHLPPQHVFAPSLELQASYFNSPTRSDRDGFNHPDKCVLPHVYL